MKNILNKFEKLIFDPKKNIKVAIKVEDMEKIEAFGNMPQARFGHTITYIAKGKAILFGGATGDTGRFSITGETYSFDVNTKFWKKVETTGSQPSPRAAHAAVAVELNQVVVYGGATGGGSLASDDLYLLDLRGSDETGIWTVVPVVGQTPGRRYGHTITYTKPFLVVFGGNTGQEPVNDCWFLNVEKSPFNWAKVDTSKQELPRVRVYHSASLCTQGSANGMVVIFGGRSNDQSALSDTWGLRRHRDGSWDWVRAPSKAEKDQPTGRYQHSSTFLGKMLLIIGGRTNNVGENLALEVYDTETSEWAKFNSLQRFRHGSWISDNFAYIYGGFELESPNIPTDQITRLNLLKCFQTNSDLTGKIIQFLKQQSPTSAALFANTFSNATSPSQSELNSTMSSATQQQPQYGQNKSGPNSQNNSFTTSPQSYSPVMNGYGNAHQGNSPNNASNINNNQYMMGLNAVGNKLAPQSKQPSSTGGPNAVRVSTPKQFEFLDPLQAEETKQTNQKKKGKNGISGQNTSNPKIYRGQSHDPQSIHNIMIQHLLQPKNYINLPESAAFKFTSEHIIQLCDLAEEIIRNQPMVLRVRAPLKIFGDIHGQYSDLMRFFDLWGSPCENGKDGDIESFDYLFLGDYVDRGSHSLETICLLFALKVRYPNQFHLIRGNHEDKCINNGFGFSDECNLRLGEDPSEDDSVFNRVNRLFEWLPLATIIEDKIICLHGGIGSSLHYVSEIEDLQRPLEVIHEVNTPEQQLVVDILWSDPTESDQELGILPNIIRDPAGTGNIVKFGPDRVTQFLNQNNLSMIIRAHECVMDGFERFAGGKLITVFSATDYCGRHKNAGAVLILRNNFEIIPKLIYPSDAAQQQHNWIDNDEALQRRPPTPPRWVSNNNHIRKSFD